MVVSIVHRRDIHYQLTYRRLMLAKSSFRRRHQYRQSMIAIRRWCFATGQ
jgi:hypothetical protein